jgi:hypothetical protein
MFTRRLLGFVLRSGYRPPGLDQGWAIAECGLRIASRERPLSVDALISAFVPFGKPDLESAEGGRKVGYLQHVPTTADLRRGTPIRIPRNRARGTFKRSLEVMSPEVTTPDGAKRTDDSHDHLQAPLRYA